MGHNELIAFSFILVYGASSLPWPRSQNSSTATMTAGSGSVGSKTPLEKSVKFPNIDSGSTRPGDIVRSPVGGWARPSVLNNISRASLSHDDGGIIFPNDHSSIEDLTTFVPKIGRPGCSKDSLFCEAVDNYPREYLKEILQNSVIQFKSLFGEDIKDQASSDGISHRIDGGGENPLCDFVEEIIFPRTAKNKDNKWMFIVNLEEPYNQGIRIEKCLNSGSCVFSDSFPMPYKPYCKQKYIYRKMVALDENGKAVTDTFKLPSCCACVYKAEPGLSSRSGSPHLISRRPVSSTPPPNT